MHNTIIILKKEKEGLEGLVQEGVIEKVRIDPEIFEHSYIQLYDFPVIYICEMQAAVTRGDRTGRGIRDIDEILRLRKIWEDNKSGVDYSNFFVEPELKYSKQ